LISDDDDATVILEWDGVNPQYLLKLITTVIPEVQVNISRSAAQLKVAYDVMYVSVMISHPCGQNLF
jgi:hypothetical protein